ncbi:laccase 14 [Mycena rosella]|uniref:Laccase 14 n=1 Tax=Mycena rosella TaxID=1033263 RepID=A0AAD7BVS2_MYCRO|nr:laccase 14 [Mycena rosella]
MFLSAALLIFSTLPEHAQYPFQSTSLEIVNKVISPDGYRRSAVLAGGTFPGPLIKGNKVCNFARRGPDKLTSSQGDRFMINVEDKLNDATMLTDTSIHWHGILQHECPITPGHSFPYSFQVPDQAGTFWYHSHLSTQYCDGLRGPFVVYDPNDPAKHLYESTIITLADWYHYPAMQATTNQPPKFNSTLINGLGRYEKGPLSDLAVINVTHGKRYRFRLIGLSCDPNFFFSIDGHHLTIIEVDGVNHKPVVADQIQIFAGQRYSFVLTANQIAGNYWIRALPNQDGANVGSFVNGTNSAILRYAGAPEADPKTSSVATQPLVETSLHPLVPSRAPGNPYPGGADYNIRLELGLDLTTFKFLVNGTTFVTPSTPVLLQILSGKYKAQDLLPKNNLFEFKPNKIVEISIIGGGPGAPHPFHLHGHNFYVVRSANSSTYNFQTPVIRDVVNAGVSADDLATFRFVTDNKGPWMLHCHVDWHLEGGMAVVLAEDIPDMAKENPPPAWDQLCPSYNQTHNLGY